MVGLKNKFTMSKKTGALVGEKSQSVYSANWKLDAVLQRELQMLDVSEKRVTHRISLNQRVVNLRFQQKLHRSKIFHARMTGNKEMLRQLITHDNYNFSLSRSDSDTLPPAYLRNLQSRARSAPATRSTSREDGSGRKVPDKTKSKPTKIKKFGGMTPAATPVTVWEDEKVAGSKESQDTAAKKGRSDKLQDTSVKKEKDSTATIGKSDKLQDTSVEKDKDSTATKGRSNKLQDTSVEKETYDNPKVPTAHTCTGNDINNVKVDHSTSEKHGKTSDEEPSRFEDDTIPRLSRVFRKSTLSATVRSSTNLDRISTNRPKTAIGTMPIIEANRADTVLDGNDDPLDSNDDHTHKETTGVPQGTNFGPSVFEQASEITNNVHSSNANHSTDAKLSSKSSVSFKQTAMVALLGASLEKQFMKSKQEQAASSNKHSMPSIFGEEKRPTILELNEARIRQANFSGRVKKFADKMDNYTDPENVDYYALRLEDNANMRTHKRGNSFSKSDVNLKAERDLAKRSEGNLKAKNMTFRSVTKPF
ncbi:uncharacterized protein [Amphiura filiformis]|uniref:uncharacterized protein n=1 Tax=Amphiura filiformis TaxID=82378 RepID=UPI003B2162E1